MHFEYSGGYGVDVPPLQIWVKFCTDLHTTAYGILKFCSQFRSFQLCRTVLSYQYMFDEPRHEFAPSEADIRKVLSDIADLFLNPISFFPCVLPVKALVPTPGRVKTTAEDG